MGAYNWEAAHDPPGDTAKRPPPAQAKLFSPVPPYPDNPAFKEYGHRHVSSILMPEYTEASRQGSQCTNEVDAT